MMNLGSFLNEALSGINTKEVLIDRSTFLEGSQKFSNKERDLIRRIASAVYNNPALQNQTFKVKVDFASRTFTLQVINPKVARFCGYCPDIVKGDFLDTGMGALSSMSKQFLIPAK